MRPGHWNTQGYLLDYVVPFLRHPVFVRTHTASPAAEDTQAMPNLRITKLYTAEQIRNSPSRGDGISESLENDYRRTTCLFIKAAGKELELWVKARDCWLATLTNKLSMRFLSLVRYSD